MDLKEELERLSERNAQPLDRAALGQGSWSEEEYKDAFLDLLKEGLIPPEAAEQLGTTGSFFRKYRNPKSMHYDQDFANRFEDTLDEHREALLQRIRKAGIEEALRGNARLIEKWLMILDPEWAPLRPQNFKLEVNIEHLQQLLPSVSNETLQRMIEEAQSAKALPEITQ